MAKPLLSSIRPQLSATYISLKFINSFKNRDHCIVTNSQQENHLLPFRDPQLSDSIMNQHQNFREASFVFEHYFLEVLETNLLVERNRTLTIIK